jgi:hypothetical protein
MVCKNHPNVPATVHCAGCAEPFCENCSLELNGQTYCGSCKVLALGNRQLAVESRMQMSTEAKSAMTSALIGMFCFGFILGPVAIGKAWGARKAIAADPSMLGWGRTTATIVIAIIVTALSVWGLINRFSAGH